MSSRLTRQLAVALLALAGATAAQANWFRNYTSPVQYQAGFTQVPDLDQRRDDLPGDGSMYCAPTTAVNWLAYIANHGYPFIRPGDESQAFWHSGGAYDDVTGLLLQMGMLMGTDPVEGTSGNGSMAGYRNWLALTDSEFFVNFHHVWLGGGTSTPRFDSIANWVNSGVPVAGVVGWYDDDGVTITRDGGHVFSVVGVERSGTERWLTFHDPADDRELDEQSEPTPLTFAIEPRVRFVQGLPRVVDKVVDYGSGYLDEYVAIRPLAGLATSSNGLQLVLAKPWRFSFDPDPVLDTFASPLGAQIADVAHCPLSLCSFLVTRPVPGVASSKLWRFDPVTRGYTELAALDDGKYLELDRFGRIHVLDGRTIRCLEVDPEDRVEEVATVVPPAPCDALAIDDLNDHLLVLCDGSVRPYALGDLGALPAVPVPAGAVLGGPASLSASPRDGAIFLTSELSPAVYRLDRQGGFRAIGQGLLARPRDVSVGDGDGVYVVDGATGLTLVFRQDPQSGDWVAFPQAPFAGLEVGRNLTVARSRTNFDPAIHTGPGYRNVLPPQTAASGVDAVPSGALPRLLAISNVAPNPFNPSTTIQLDLPRSEPVTLAVHDLGGRLVRTVWDGELAAGRHSLVWDGADARGAAAASGVYLVRLSTADGVQQTVKVTLSK